MIIHRIYLRNYRNYVEQEIFPGQDVNMVYGKNAQGKTNLLESLFVCSVGRSHRTQRDEILVRDGETRYDIRVEGSKNGIPFSIGVSYDREQKKTVRINQLPVQKIGQLMGVLNTVLFSPEDLQVVKSGPAERRRLIDILISQTYPPYFFSLQEYARILMQKNALLKKERVDGSLLEVFNEKLAAAGAQILSKRLEFLQELDRCMKQIHDNLSNGKETVSLSYVSSAGEKGRDAEGFQRKLEQEMQGEIRNRISSVGPHRDDFIIGINGRDIRKYGSQGQQRTAVLSLKLAEIDMIRNKTGHDPVLLLDDVMSELDIFRRKHLLENLETVQVFLTSTEKKAYAGLRRQVVYFQICGGTVEKKPE